jgi:hypothetical protein
MDDFFNATTRSHHMASGIVDLGGLTIDLEGGQYLISEPIQIPPMYGNAHIIDGTLRASTSFPSDRWLLEIGDSTKCHPKLPNGDPDKQGSCNEFIDVSSVLLDANFIAAGGAKLEMVMGMTLANIFVTGFRKVGIQVTSGHAVMISDAWLAECYWSDNKSSNSSRCPKPSESIAIQIHGYDHYITNTIVFDFTRIGVEIVGASNVLQGVHTWNGGGVGIQLGNATKGSGSNRLIGCYLDYNSLDLYDPSGVFVESTFFLKTHTNLHAVHGKINGLTMRFNQYHTEDESSVVLHGTFHSVSGVSIVEDVNAAKTTRATKSFSQRNTTRWFFDFSSVLLFPTIDRVSYSITSLHKSFFSHMARPPNGTTVLVETSEPVDATVVVTVEQGV